MKKTIWSVILAFVLCEGFIVSALPGQGTCPPDIDFSEEVWDFGTVKQGEKVTHVFEVKNLGGAELVISGVRTSCGCTTALLSSPETAPGSSSQIKVTFDSSRFEGKITHYIYIESNDPDEGLRKLAITAIVEVPPKSTMKQTKASWDFGLITEGERLTYILSVANRGEQELAISEIRTSAHCTAEVLSANSIRPGRMAKIRISYDSTGRKGVVREYLYIDFSEPSKKTAVFPITGYVMEPKSELAIFPIFLDFGTIKQGEERNEIIKLKNWGEKEIEIVNIDSSSKLIIVNPSSEEIDPGEETRINVSLNPGEEIGPVEEYLYITIALPLEVVIKER